MSSSRSDSSYCSRACRVAVVVLGVRQKRGDDDAVCSIQPPYRITTTHPTHAFLSYKFNNTPCRLALSSRE